MFRMYARNYHSYTHLILALGIVRKPMVWGFITSEYPGIHDVGLPDVTRRPGPAPSPRGSSCSTSRVGESVKQASGAQEAGTTAGHIPGPTA